MKRNLVSPSKHTEDNEPDHLTDNESGIYSVSGLSGLSSSQRSQKDPVSHKRHHFESTVRLIYLNNSILFLYI